MGRMGEFRCGARVFGRGIQGVDGGVGWVFEGRRDLCGVWLIVL